MAKLSTTTGEEIRKPRNFATRLFFPFLSNPPAEITAADRMLLHWNRQNPTQAWAPDEPSRTLTLPRGSGRSARIELNPKAYEYLQRRSAVLSRQRTPSFRADVDERTSSAIKAAFEDGREQACEELRRWPVENLGK